jgi:hypothetical protein
LPQPPQFRLSVWVSTHAVNPNVVQDVSPFLHELHFPSTQLSMPAGQRFPQALQLLESVCVLVHVPPQFVSPVEQTHFPFVHVPPPPHEALQLPQLALSVCRSTQELPLHRLSGGPESVLQSTAHLPLAQTGVPPSTVHFVPQAPQLFGSLRIAVHAPPLHSASAAGQAHRPAWQLFDWVHCSPQLLQFKLSFWRSKQLLPHLLRGATQPHVPALHV